MKKIPYIHLIIIVIIILNFIVILFHAFNSVFDHDELYFAHVSWNIHQGKLIYKDFFEHHGVLYFIPNEIAFRIFDLQPEFDTLFVLRYISLGFLISILILVYKISKYMFKLPTIGLLSVAILTGLFFFQDKAIEIRADVMQNFFWLTGLYLFLINIKKRNDYLTFISGLLFGAAIFTNLKSIICIIGIGVYLFINHIIIDKDIKHFIRKVTILSSSTLIIFIIISIYFYLVDALNEFIFFNFVFNWKALLIGGRTKQYLAYHRLFLEELTTFVFSLFLGTVLLIKHLMLKNKKSLAYKEILLLASVSLIPTLIILYFGFYGQSYLMILPILSIVAAWGLYQIVIKATKINKIIPLIILIIILGSLTLTSFKKAPLKPDLWLNNQRDLTNFMLENSEREDPILYIWNGCGGYMFNEDIQFYWRSAEGFNTIFESIEGYDLFGQHLIDLLEEKKVKYLIATKEFEIPLSSQILFDYIFEKYNRKHMCLWERKEV